MRRGTVLSSLDRWRNWSTETNSKEVAKPGFNPTQCESRVCALHPMLPLSCAPNAIPMPPNIIQLKTYVKTYYRIDFYNFFVTKSVQYLLLNCFPENTSSMRLFSNISTIKLKLKHGTKETIIILHHTQNYELFSKFFMYWTCGNEIYISSKHLVLPPPRIW